MVRNLLGKRYKKDGIFSLQISTITNCQVFKHYRLDSSSDSQIILSLLLEKHFERIVNLFTFVTQSQHIKW
jgi:hypothetical protein